MKVPLFIFIFDYKKLIWKKKVQAIGRALFRGYVVTMLTFMVDKSFIWALPFGLLIGLLSEVEEFTKK